MNEYDKPQPDNALSPSPPSYEPITVNQVRAGRAIARLSVRDLASAAGLSPAALSHLETGHTRTPHKATLSALRAALTAHGIDFAPDGWTRHIGDACAAQHPPSEGARSVEASHGDDDRPEEEEDLGEPSGPDLRELNQWLAAEGIVKLT